MATSGNGTNAAQWLYVKMNIPFFWRWKIGVTGYLWKRTKQTSADVPGFYLPVAFIWMWGAWPIEQFILNSTKGLRRQIMGRGGREIRPWYIGLLAALFVYLAGLVKWTAPFFIAFGIGYLGER